MKSRSIKYDVYDFVKSGDASGVLYGLTAWKVAEAFMEMHPNITHSIYTVEKYVVHTRAGKLKLRDEVDIDDVVQAMMDNRAEAERAFIPSVQLDTDPLGVMDINRVFFEVPESLADHPAMYDATGMGKLIGIISDVHLPLHDRPALMGAASYLKDQNIELLILNGDILDCSNLTRHSQRKPMRYTWSQELEVARAFFASLRVLFPKIPILYLEGNHENWVKQYLVRQAPQLSGDYELEKVLSLDQYCIQWLPEDRVVKYGKLYIMHGHQLRIGGSMNVAEKVLRKVGVNIMCGHWHQQSYYEKKNLVDEIHACWINGALCDLHPDYMPYNNHGHGLALVELLDDNGTFNVTQRKVINGRVIG
jgi:predicted phosphodiesterase